MLLMLLSAGKLSCTLFLFSSSLGKANLLICNKFLSLCCGVVERHFHFGKNPIKQNIT